MFLYVISEIFLIPLYAILWYANASSVNRTKAVSWFKHIITYAVAFSSADPMISRQDVTFWVDELPLPLNTQPIPVINPLIPKRAHGSGTPISNGNIANDWVSSDNDSWSYTPQS
jgi:hypothetical protein